MAKTKEAAEVAAPEKREYFYPPQDGRPAFVCEATSQAEADAIYQSVDTQN